MAASPKAGSSGVPAATAPVDATARPRRLAAVVIAVPALDPAIAAYERLGFAVTDRSPRTGWGIEAAMLGVEGGMLELIAPTDPDLPVGRAVSRFLARRGPGLYMVSFEVADADAEYEALLAAGVDVPAAPVDAPGDAGMSSRLFWPSPAAAGGALLEFMQLDGPPGADLDGSPGADFVWRDAGRTVVFRAALLAEAPQVLAGHGFGGFELFATARGRAAAPALVAAAAAIHDVAPGPVADAAAALVNEVGGELPLVALGGGRVIDAAKAVGSLRGLEVATVATTMSGAEMTDLHALPAGRRPARGRLRPSLVLADPEAMTSAPEPALRASSMNALAHGADSLYTPFANPMSRHAALRGAASIANALDEPAAGRDRRALALGSILCGYAIDSGRLGIHHVVCQSLARVVGTPHAQNNAAVLPHALAYLVAHGAAGMAKLAAALGTDPSSLAARVRTLGGDPAGIGTLGADPDLVPAALDTMLAHRELAFAPGPPTREDLAAIVDAAW